jgi:hypothetical protein
MKQPSHDYSVSVQILCEDKKVMAGADRPLTDGYYPSHLWIPNEIIKHKHPITIPYLPSGEYRLILSVYDVVTKKPLNIGLNSEHFTPEGYLLVSWRHQDTLHTNCTYGDSEWHCTTYTPFIIYNQGQTKLIDDRGNGHIGE